MNRDHGSSLCEDTVLLWWSKPRRKVKKELKMVVDPESLKGFSSGLCLPKYNSKAKVNRITDNIKWLWLSGSFSLHKTLSNDSRSGLQAKWQNLCELIHIRSHCQKWLHHGKMTYSSNKLSRQLSSGFVKCAIANLLSVLTYLQMNHCVWG